MKKFFVVGALVAIFATSADAQIGGVPSNDSFKAYALYSACTHPPSEKPEDHEFAEQTCSTYMRGLTDGLFVMQSFAANKRRTCLPTDTAISNAEARRIFESWLRAHPEAATNSAGMVATFAIVSAYPCR